MSTGIKIMANEEGAKALEELADAMILATNDLDIAIKVLQNSLSSSADGLGEYKEQIENIIQTVQYAVNNASESISVLPGKMRETSNLIREFAQKKSELFYDASN